MEGITIGSQASSAVSYIDASPEEAYYVELVIHEGLHQVDAAVAGNDGVLEAIQDDWRGGQSLI